MTDKLCVFAGNFGQYRHYCREHDLDPQRDAVFATQTSIRGIHFKKFVCVGTYASDPHFIEIYNYVSATLDREPDESATTSALPFTKNLVVQTDAEKIATMKTLLEEAAGLMHPVHTTEMKAWWEKARGFVLDEVS